MSIAAGDGAGGRPARAQVGPAEDREEGSDPSLAPRGGGGGAAARAYVCCLCYIFI